MLLQAALFLSVLWLTNNPLYTTSSLFTPLDVHSVNGHLGYFHDLAK